jgi:hypothetical protein
MLDVLLLLGLPLAGSESARFDEAKPGGLPPGFTAAVTHEGVRPRWEVVSDETAPSKRNVLAQLSSEPARAQFPLAVFEGASFENGEIEVKFKPVSGEVDRAAGLVWRYRDENHYYIVRANALEDNVVLYKVEGGKRTSLAPKGTPEGTYGVDREVPSGRWSTLKVDVDGPRFTVFFDGEKLFEVEDRTFEGAGKVGLWTKADSVTYFDDFEIRGK